MTPRTDATAAPTDARVIRTRRDVLDQGLHLLVDEGWEAVTHARLAEAAGYSRATVYKHWPTRGDLLRDTFARFRDVDHHTPTGDLRADLVAELRTFRIAMEEQRLDRALAVLVDLTATMPEMVPVREQLVADGERLVRELLAPVLSGDALEAATLMLCGAILQSALMHGRLPGDTLIAATVDLVLAGLDDVSSGGIDASSTPLRPPRRSSRGATGSSRARLP